MALTLGVAILRRSATLLAVQEGKPLSIVLVRRVERAPKTTPGQILRTLLSDAGVPPATVRLAIALSPADLACADAWSLAPDLARKPSSRLGAALCEPRCVSETLETLIVDAPLSGGAAQAVALDRQKAEELVAAAGDRAIRVVTALPAALAQAFDTAAFTYGGERFEVASQTWRAYPVDRPDETGSLKWGDLDVSFAQAPAFAAAVCDPESVPNLLNAMPRYRKTWAHRLRDPLLNVGAAAVLCLAALGLQFHREALQERDDTAAARRIETELWHRHLPTEEPREGRLLKAMHDRLADLGETGGGPEFPSALAFWGEIGKQMPDPAALGLTLESLDLAPDGGRLSARVPVFMDDPLKNASQLEGRLNESKKMKTRGDYEVRDGQVQVRLRMDYRP